MGGSASSIRISGIPAMALGKSPEQSLFATGNRLSEFAKLLELKFEFMPILTPIRELNESSAVNFMLQLYNLLDWMKLSSPWSRRRRWRWWRGRRFRFGRFFNGSWGR